MRNSDCERSAPRSQERPRTLHLCKWLLRSVSCLVLLFASTGSGVAQGVDDKNTELTLRLVQNMSGYGGDSKHVTGERVTPGVYLGLALDGQTPAFDGDIRRARDRLFLQAASGPVLLLSNLKAEPEVEPHADTRTLPTVAKAAGRWLREYALQHKSPALAVVAIGAHGGNDVLTLRLANEPSRLVVRADYLVALLNDLGNGPAVIIISACHAGSFIPALRAPNRIIITAAAADRVSFGCGRNSTSTVFMQALLDKELNRKFSLTELFEQANERVTGYEARTKLEHSRPQIDVGADMQKFSLVPISQWSTALKDFRMSTLQE